VNVAKDDCQYLYYVLADADGRHTFAVTLEQHEANVAKALADGLL
jgi:cell division protein YceG involved in septum cleavage